MVRPGPLVGLLAQFLLLGALGAAFDLGIAGWLAATVYALVTCVTLSGGLRGSGVNGLGPADLVTLTRAILVGGVVALTMASFSQRPPIAMMTTLATVALLLDAVDGKVARRTGTASALGARFDMEVDAFLILVLSVFVARSLGVWVLTIGAMRYAFVVAAWALPWMRASLPSRYWRKVVAATQGVVLVVASAHVLSRPLMTATLVCSLLLLVESFGRDVVWLWRSRTSRAPLSPAQPLHLPSPALRGATSPVD